MKKLNECKIYLNGGLKCIVPRKDVGEVLRLYKILYPDEIITIEAIKQGEE